MPPLEGLQPASQKPSLDTPPPPHLRAQRDSQAGLRGHGRGGAAVEGAAARNQRAVPHPDAPAQVVSQCDRQERPS